MGDQNGHVNGQRPAAEPYGVLPSRLVEFEARYDRPTGGWSDPVTGAVGYAHVEREVGRLYHALTMLLQPVHVLETGTHAGYSTSCIAAALRDLGGRRQIFTVDPLSLPHLWQGTGLDAFITFIPKKSQDAADDLSHITFDMLVLDSDHHYETIMSELQIFEPRLRPGGVIVLHDSLFFDGVGLAVRQLRECGRFDVVTFESPRRHSPATVRSPGITIAYKIADGPPHLEVLPEHRGTFDGNSFTLPIIRRDQRPHRTDAGGEPAI